METQLHFENRHTGEKLRLRRVREQGVEILEIEGDVPPFGEGPPKHVHIGQVEEMHVVSGVLTASVGDRVVTVRAGESAVLPADVPHTWWNADAEPLVVKGRAIPAGNLDQFLPAIIAVMNASPKNRPSIFHMAHLLHRNRHAFQVLVMPLWVQRVMFPVIIAIGHLIGAYPKTGWPGSPDSCPGAPLVADSTGQVPQLELAGQARAGR